MQVAAPHVEKNIADVNFEIVGRCGERVWAKTVVAHLTSLLESQGISPQSSSTNPNRTGRSLIVRGDYYFDRSAVEVLLASNSNCFIVAGDAQASRKTIELIAAIYKAEDRDVVRNLIDNPHTELSKLPSRTDFIYADAPPTVYDYALRKTSVPFVRKVTTASVPEIERRTFDLAYKGVTDVVTKYVYPWPAFQATRLAAHAGIAPNAVTFVSLLCVFGVMALFADGQFAPGLALGFTMSFLDTLDGKLARVTQTSSRFGKHFDHLIDMIHPPFWWAAWWLGVAQNSQASSIEDAAIISTVGYVAIRLQEWRFKLRFGVRIHVWKPFDSKFRLITSRRNPNLLLLSAAVMIGEPAMGLLWVAGWTVASFAIHGVRWVQAEVEQSRNGPLHSWLESSPAS
jgi:hypothetical protein